VRCAHNPPPRHFFANLQLSIPVFNSFFHDMLSKNSENKSAKSDQVAMDFLDFGYAELRFLMIWDAPSGPFGAF